MPTIQSELPGVPAPVHLHPLLWLTQNRSDFTLYIQHRTYWRQTKGGVSWQKGPMFSGLQQNWCFHHRHLYLHVSCETRPGKIDLRIKYSSC